MKKRLFSTLRAALRLVPACAIVLGVAACGSPTSIGVPRTAPAPVSISEDTPRFARGPIATACMIHDRRAASPSRCGCVQAAANLTLSQDQQLRAVRFFSEPELLQTVKLSDTPQNERFWATWATFADTAEELCRDT